MPNKSNQTIQPEIEFFLLKRISFMNQSHKKTKQNRKQNDRSHYDDNNITNDFECDD